MLLESTTDTSQLDDFVSKVLYCDKNKCPFYQSENGRYPKYSYGNPESKVMAIFQNPGSPDRDKDNPELKKNIENITVREMRQYANNGIEKWLFKLINESTVRINGQPFCQSFYITQSYRCPDPVDEDKSKKWKDAMSNCYDYLDKEIKLVNPHVIFTFGKRSLECVARVFEKEDEVKNLKFKKKFEERKFFIWNGVKIFPVVHPNGFRRNEIKQDDYEKTIRYFIGLIDNNKSNV